jgi:hypothetical protein
MKLNKKEIDVLSLIDDQSVDDFLELASKNTKYKEEDIQNAVAKLLNEKFIEIITLPQGDSEKKWYFRTKKGESVKLNDDLRYIDGYGYKFGDGIKDGPIKKFIEDVNKK